MTIKRAQDMSINRVINGVTGKQSRYSAVTISSYPYYDTDPLYGSSIGQLASAGNLYNLSNTLYAGSLQSISSNIYGDSNAFFYTGTVTFRTFVATSNDVSVFPSLVVDTKYGVAKCSGTGVLTYKNNLPVLVAGIGAGGGGGINTGGGGGAGVFYSTSYDMKRLSNGLSFSVGLGGVSGTYSTDASGYASGNAYGVGTYVTAIDNTSNYIIYCEGGNPGSSPYAMSSSYGANGGYLSGSSTTGAGWNTYGSGGGGAGSTVASADVPSVNYSTGGEFYSTSINSFWDSTAPFISANRKGNAGGAGNSGTAMSPSGWRAGGGGGGARTAGSAPTNASTLGYGTLSSFALSGVANEQIGGLGGRGIPWCQVFSATNDGTEIGVGGQGCHSFTLSSNPNATAINAALTSLLGNSGMSYGGQHIVSGGVDQTGSTSSKGMDGAANTGNGGGGNPVAPASTANWGAKGGSGCVWVVFKVIG